jgi:hypothetical protein
MGNSNFRDAKTRVRDQKGAIKKGVFLLILLFSCILLTNFATITYSAGPERIRVISAGATSATEDSLPVELLLDPTKKGFWQPKGEDEGVNEGLFFQFDSLVLVDFIEVRLQNAEGNEWEYRLKVYLDGQNLTSNPEQEDELWYGSEKRKEGKDLIIRCGAFALKDWERELQPLGCKVRSVFIKIEGAKKKPQVTSVRFYREGDSQPLSVELPLMIPGMALASSTLTPEPAYTVFNLFDSREDFAWSTNGNRTGGLGERIEFSFDIPQSLSGLMVWNGYQRSETHYKANGRPASLKVIVDEGKEFTLPVKDLYGSQVIRFPEVVQNVEKLVLQIDKIYRGGSYQDVLISELKFVDDKNRIINLQTPRLQPEVTEKMVGILDVTLAPFLLGVGGDDEEYYFFSYYPFRGLRFRSDGSFVIYQHVGNEIMEGNWEPNRTGARIFGKRYMTNPRASEYLQAVQEKRAVRIFQADVTIQKISAMSFEEAKKYLEVMLEERNYSKVSTKTNPVFWWMGIEPYGKVNVPGKTKEELMRGVYKKAIEEEALFVTSPLFVDLFIPLNRTEQTYDIYSY